MIPRTFRLVVLTLALLSAVLPGHAYAQAEEETANAEDVAIGFFKTADTNPDFDLWAKGTKDYAVQSVVQAPEYVFQEKQRLMKKWKKYNPDEDVLTIRANVSIELKAVADKDENISYWMNMVFTDGRVTYFPFKFQEYKIAVIPQKIDSLLIQPITKEQFEMMSADFDGKRGGSAIMYFGLKPVRAYIHQPYQIDNIDQWALLCDIATMGLKSIGSGASFWYYTADWYTSPKAKELHDLYQTKGSISGSVTPQTP